ncbi:MAG: hypothetical protein K2P81_09005 [Bacteriovoracaceae bacterium]|nr:hypothetical protein [Bacteriovoracaceae bacterium]
MKYVLILLTLTLSAQAFAVAGLKYAAGTVNSLVSFNAAGNCLINGFEIKSGDTSNPTNTKEIGWQLCLAAGTYSTTGFSVITGGSYPGAWRASTEVDVASKCTIQYVGQPGAKATCNDAVSCSAMSPPTC